LSLSPGNLQKANFPAHIFRLFGLFSEHYVNDISSLEDNSGFGKAINFMSLGALVPGWDPNPLESLKQWGEAIVGKGGGGTVMVYLLNKEGTITTLRGSVSAGSNAIGGKILSGTLHFIADAGTVASVAATGIDGLVHAGCDSSARNVTGQANLPVYVAP
jgi:hypothetical protein